MRLELELDFCIINNPIYEDDNYFIYFTRRNFLTIDFSIREEDSYDQLIDFLRKLGYEEVDYLTFQFIEDEENEEQLLPEKIKEKLENIGAEYSQNLEELVNETLEKFKEELDNDLENMEDYIEKDFKVPAVGEKISPYFYLFLECFFTNEIEAYLRLTGDFRSRKNTSTRNYLGIINTEFERVECDKPGYFCFESCKSGPDLIKSIPFLQAGYFNIASPEVDEEGQMRETTRTFFYTILEIRDKIRSTDRIMIEVPIKTFQNLMFISSDIKIEMKIDDKEEIPQEDITLSFDNLKDIITKRMLDYADEEEFRKAAALKKDLQFIKKKESFYLNKINRNILYKEYKKIFCFS